MSSSEPNNRRSAYQASLRLLARVVLGGHEHQLADHGITLEEVRQVSDGDRIVIGNPRPRVVGSVLMIFPTMAGGSSPWC